MDKYNFDFKKFNLDNTLKNEHKFNGETIDIAKCVNWLIEDNYTTGQIISINGGWSIT